MPQSNRQRTKEGDRRTFQTEHQRTLKRTGSQYSERQSSTMSASL